MILVQVNITNKNPFNIEKKKNKHRKSYFSLKFQSMQVRLSKAQKIQIANSKDVYAIMQSILLRQNRLHRKQEYFWIIGLDSKENILYVELLAIGSGNMVILKISDILRMAIYKNAAQIILVHNHPSGTLKPSDSDLIFTERVLKGADATEIVLLDHMIISEKSYFSFKDKKIMPY